MSKNHVRACLRKTVAALGQWQSDWFNTSGSNFSILLCLVDRKLILGSKTNFS